MRIEIDAARNWHFILTYQNVAGESPILTGQQWALILKIEVVSRSGKIRIVTITPESHKKMYESGELLLKKLTKAIEELKKSFVSKELLELKKLFS